MGIRWEREQISYGRSKWETRGAARAQQGCTLHLSVQLLYCIMYHFLKKRVIACMSTTYEKDQYTEWEIRYTRVHLWVKVQNPNSLFTPSPSSTLCPSKWSSKGWKHSPKKQDTTWLLLSHHPFSILNLVRCFPPWGHERRKNVFDRCRLLHWSPVFYQAAMTRCRKLQNQHQLM